MKELIVVLLTVLSMLCAKVSDPNVRSAVYDNNDFPAYEY